MEIKPVRIQRSRKHKQVSPNGLPIVYVGRPSQFGNPFFVIHRNGIWIVKDKMTPTEVNCNSKECAIYVSVRLYKEYLEAKIKLGFDLSKLKGKNLSCWCALDCKCHADVLLEIANIKY